MTDALPAAMRFAGLSLVVVVLLVVVLFVAGCEASLSSEVGSMDGGARDAAAPGDAAPSHDDAGPAADDAGAASETDAAAQPDAGPDPCSRATLGDGWYCGEPLGGDPSSVYRCEGAVTAERIVCELGCRVMPPGVPDACATPAPDGYLLPLACGASSRVSQGNHSGFSHEGLAAYAFDFAIPRGTPMVAMESGTVSMVRSDVRPGDPCWSGGGRECANTVNYVLLAHDDGTDTLYLHLDEGTVRVGDRVARGQMIGLSGGTGWSTGPHAHVQRQRRCGSWWCQSVELRFGDVESGGGIPSSGATVTSGNCP